MNQNLIKLIVCMVVLSLLIPVTCMGEEIVLKLGTQAQASSDWIGYLDRVNTRLGELSRRYDAHRDRSLAASLAQR